MGHLRYHGNWENDRHRLAASKHQRFKGICYGLMSIKWWPCSIWWKSVLWNNLRSLVPRLSTVWKAGYKARIYVHVWLLSVYCSIHVILQHASKFSTAVFLYTTRCDSGDTWRAVPVCLWGRGGKLISTVWCENISGLLWIHSGVCTFNSWCAWMALQ